MKKKLFLGIAALALIVASTGVFFANSTSAKSSSEIVFGKIEALTGCEVAVVCPDGTRLTCNGSSECETGQLDGSSTLYVLCDGNQRGICTNN